MRILTQPPISRVMTEIALNSLKHFYGAILEREVVSFKNANFNIPRVNWVPTTFPETSFPISGGNGFSCYGNALNSSSDLQLCEALRRCSPMRVITI